MATCSAILGSPLEFIWPYSICSAKLMCWMFRCHFIYRGCVKGAVHQSQVNIAKRKSFAGNVIPESRIHALKLMMQYHLKITNLCALPWFRSGAWGLELPGRGSSRQDFRPSIGVLSQVSEQGTPLDSQAFIIMSHVNNCDGCSKLSIGQGPHFVADVPWISIN